jgi:type II secretory pathway pseudopilin PulG
MRRGHTLVEMMIVLLIVVFLVGAMFMVLSTGRPTWGMSEARAALQLELRKAMLRITDDLKQTSINQTYTDETLSTSFPSGGNYSEIYFKVPASISNSTGAISWDSDAIGYAISGTTIVRSDGGTPTDISSNITAMNFIRLANDVIEIYLAAQKIISTDRGSYATIEANLTSAVAARN